MEHVWIVEWKALGSILQKSQKIVFQFSFKFLVFDKSCKSKVYSFWTKNNLAFLNDWNKDFTSHNFFITVTIQNTIQMVQTCPIIEWSSFWMVWFSNGGLNIRLKKACLWSTMSHIWMVSQVTWLYFFNTGQQKSAIFRWIWDLCVPYTDDCSSYEIKSPSEYQACSVFKWWTSVWISKVLHFKWFGLA